jgi:hypothetical protein
LSLPPWAWLLAGVSLLVILVMLEGKRQERRYGRSGRGTMMRTGLLELQRHLQPERKVEIFLEKRERTVQAETGDKPEAGERRDGPPPGD